MSIGRLSRWNQPLELGLKQRLRYPLHRARLDASLGFSSYYMFDLTRLQKLMRSARADKSGVDRSQLLRQIYRYNSATEQVIHSASRGLLDAPGLIAVHLRRGDKIQEASYMTSEDYSKVIQSLPNWRKRPIYILSDSASAAQELATALGSDHVIVSCPDSVVSGGYSQKAFNSWPPDKRIEYTQSLLCDLEICRHASCFVGTKSSNIFHILNHLRIDHRTTSFDVTEALASGDRIFQG